MVSRPTGPGPLTIALCLAPLAVAACSGDPGVSDDNLPPEVTINAPASSAQFQPGPLFIEVAASDRNPYDTPEKLTIELNYSQTGVDGSQALSCTSGGTSPGTSGIFTCTTTHEFSAGSYVLSVRAQDSRGAYSDSDTAAFTVVNDPPTCTFQTPPSGATQAYSQEVPDTVILQCSDPDGDVGQAQVCLNSNLEAFLGCASPTSSGVTTVPIEFAKVGLHTVTATITDVAGAEGQDFFNANVAPCGDEDDDGYYACDSRDPEKAADCDDEDDLAYPDNTEICDGRDSDCDGQVDNIPDTDGDGYICEDDCDNTNISININGTEVCNGKDDDCDGLNDEDFDVDGDGYLSSCSVDGKGIDCDDANASVNPGMEEVCNGVDTNCNSIIDDKDADTDGYVDSTCVSFTGDNGGDCDDTNAFFNPGITEVCDNRDEDCDGRNDNGTTCFDDDGDGYCEAACTDGSTPGDCDDDFRWTYPGAVERFDWRDNNCDEALEDPNISIEKAWLLLDGFATSAQSGKALSGGHDVSGDGIDDMIIGAPNFDASNGGNQRGLAVVVHGREEWDVGVPLDLSVLPSAFQYTESRDNAQAGASVSIVGDMDGDGLSEFAVGAPLADVKVTQQLSFIDAGSAYLLVGKNSGWGNTTLSTARVRIDGISDGVLMGTSLDGGDVNGDNLHLADLIIGAPQPTDGATAGGGWAFVFTGRTGGFPATVKPGDLFLFQGGAGQAMGREVAVLGTHDGDGILDFAVAGDADASNRGIVVRIPGDVSVTAGNNANIAEEGSGTWTGESTGEEIGSSMDGRVDIDGNCYNDMLVGRTYLNIETADGMAYAIMGDNGVPPDNGYMEDLADVTFIPQADDHCPCTVAGVGDMNGDGLGDFAIAAAHANVGDAVGAGRVYLFYGRDGYNGGSCGDGTYTNPWPAEVDVATEADGIFYGTSDQQRIGFTLEGLGDINGDGYDDLGIGSPFYSPTPDGGAEIYQAGRVYVQFGSPTP